MKAIGIAILMVTLPAVAQRPKLENPSVITTKKDTKSDTEYRLWRSDLKAAGWTKTERFYSYSSVSILVDGKMKNVPFPSYEQMTGFPEPDPEKLRPRGWDYVIGWDKDGRLIYRIVRVPLATFTGNDPLLHVVHLEVEADKMKVVKVEHHSGEWQSGDWTSEK